MRDLRQVAFCACYGPAVTMTMFHQYRGITVDAFAYLENARFRLDEARAAGFDDAYIYQKTI